MPSLSPTISKALLRVKVRIRHPIHHRDYLNRSTPDLAAIPNSKDYNPAPQPEVEIEPATPLSYTPASSVQDLTSQNNVISSAVNTVPYVRSRASSIGSLPGAKPDTSKATRTRPPIQKRGSTAPVQALAESFKADGTGRKFVWVGLKALVQVVECGADIFPVLKLAVTGLSQCIGIFEAAATNRREFVDLHKKLDLLLKALVPFINRQWPTNQKMTGYVMNLATGILEEVKALKEKHGKAIANRLMQTVEDQNEILGYYNRIRDHLDVFKLCAALHLYETVEQQGEDAYLAKLSPVKSAVYNSGQLGKIKRRACTAGTRMAELHKLRNWAYNSDPSAQGICWMNGMAGTGKTTIAYSLCTELDDSKMLGASFFCSRLDSNCQEVTDILPSIAYQLAQFSTPFRYALLQVLKSEPDVHTLLLQKQFDSLLVKPLMEIRRLRGSSPDFVVVIDALDECEDKDSVGKILDLLLGHDDLPIRFLISSRPEREIEDRMMNKVGERFDALLVLHRLDASAVAQDIETYLEDELKDVGFTPSQLKALVERSGVLFIFAATAAQYIKAGYTLRKHTERLEVILGLKDGPNEGLDSLYSTILNLALYHSDLDESDRRDITIVLHTVTCAQEPMSIGALSGLLRQDEEQVVCLLRLLSSVLHIAEETGQKIVAPLHASFPDFMLDKARSDLFHCDPEINHQRMAEACFWIIKNNNPQFNICHLESSYDLDIEVTDIGERVAKHVSPQLFYACQYWMNHLELGGQNETLLNSLHDFLFTRLLLWIEVLNLKKSLNLGAEIMEQAENWGMEQGWSKDIIEMVHDAWRFVTMFASNPVSQSTPHLYVSMLPFWPKPSPIHQHYTSRAQNLINPQGTAMVRRRPALLADWYFDVKIECPSFSEDGSQIVFGLGKDMYIRDGSTGELIAGPLKGHTKTISSACFSSDGLRVVSGSWDKTVRVWDVQSGETVVGPLQHTSSVESVAYSPDGTCIAAGGWDKEVVVWDLKTCKAISELKGHTSLVTSIAFSPNGKLIASGSSDKTVRVWDFRSENPCLYVLSGHTRLIKALDFSCDSKRIVSGSWDTTAQVWDVESGMAIGGPLRGHSASIHVTRFCSDGLHVLTGSSDKTICMWDAQTGEMVNSPFEGHGGSITSVWCSPDRTRIVSCAKDKVVRIWDARSKQTLFSPLQGHTDEVTSITCSSDGKRVVSGSFDNTVCVWDTQSGDMVLGPLQKHTHSVNSVAFSADGARVISAAQDKSVGMWCTQDGGMVLGWLEGHNKPVNSVAFSPDGATIASGSDDCIIQIWDANGGNTVTASLKAHIEPVNSVAFSFDGARLVSGSSDRTIRVWDLGSGETLVGPIIGHSGAVLSVAFSSDGTRIVSGSSDHTVRVWDARSGTMIFPPLMGHTDGVNSVAFSFDGTKIASGSDDWTIRLWDGESGKMILEPFEGHTEPVNSVTFSPDGAYIYSGSADDTIRAWDIRSGQIGAYQSRDDQTHITVENNELGGCHNPWRLDRGGWVVDSDSQRLLAWVPPDLRVSLLRPRNSFLISTQGSVKLDLSSAKIGPSWVDCEPSS